MLELSQALDVAGVAVVKRPTGGAVAVHGRDLSYSLTGPFPGDLLPRGPKSCYCTIHRALAEAMNRMGYPVECVPEQKGPDYRALVYCGLTLNAYDIVYAGRKVVGSAQRRTAQGFLQHGFILLDEDFGWVRGLLGTKGDEIARSCATLSEIGPKGIAPAPESLQAEILEAMGRLLGVEFKPAPMTREEEQEAKAFLVSPPYLGRD
jgi:lipoate-protein ligase A